MSRVLGIDPGEKRVGIALSDPSRIIASAHAVLQNVSTRQLCDDISGIVGEKEVGLIVIGLPINMDGSRGPQAEKAAEFAGLLASKMDIPVETWDERLTTCTAESALIEAGMRREKRKQVIDKVAAQVMLQHYLDAHTDLFEE